MDTDNRSRLLERRRLLQLRRARQEQSRTFRNIAETLCGKGLRRFARIPAVECQRIASRFAHLPGQDERFLWPDHQRRQWRDEAERDFLLRQALLSCTNLNGSVAVIFHPYQSGLRIGAASLAEFATEILDPLYEALWITAYQPASWLIEVAAQDDEVCHTLQI